MSSTHSNGNGAPKRAAIYIRMTTNRQEDSPERQRAQTVPYAAGAPRGYRLIADPEAPGYPYQDLAKPGEDARPGLARLLADAAAGLMDVIVSDEWSRLSRTEDPLDFLADVARPLRKAGVVLDTVKEGPQDWGTLAGLIMATIHQSRASDEIKTISRRVLSNARSLVANGRGAGGGTPYGYRWEYAEREKGGRRRPVPVRLVPDGLKAEVVKALFKLYDEGATLLELVEFLAERGVAPSRAGKRGKARWSRSAVRKVLRNDVYTGRYDYGRQTRAKWSRVEGGVVVPKEKGGKPPGHKSMPVSDNPADAWVTGAPHEALVSQELFDRVQARLRKNRDGRAAGARDGYVLSGLLTCGHCGRALNGHRGKYGLEYRCPGYLDGFKGPCTNAKVRQQPLLDRVVAELRDKFLRPEKLEEVRARIRRREEERRRPGNLDRLRREAAELARQVERARGNLALLEPEEIPPARRRIGELVARHDALAAELRRAEAPSQLEDLEGFVARVEANLWGLQEASRQGEPRKLRAALSALVAGVTVEWSVEATRGGRGRYLRRRLAGGVIYVADWLAGYAGLGSVEYPGAHDGSTLCAPGHFISIPYLAAGGGETPENA